MYSQNDEEKFIVDYFNGFLKANGVCQFLDIGAYDGKQFSNTLALVEKGWHGLCVEPDPVAFSSLLKTHVNHGNVSLVLGAFAAEPGMLRFYSSDGDAVSTSSDAHIQKWLSAAKFQQLYVPTVTIDDLCFIMPPPFEFINLDVESTNWELLQYLPLRDLGCKLLCVEHDEHDSEMIQYCATQGLTKIIARNPENLILAVES